jgi:MFS family permease
MEAKSVRSLVAAQAVGALGDGAFTVTVALYVTRVIGLDPTRAGLCLTAAWGLGFLAATPAGRLADRIGLRRSAVTLSAAVAGALVLAAVVRGPVAYLAVITAYAVAQSALGGARQALLAVTVPPEQRVAVRARLAVAVNAGMGIGAALGGLALLADTASAYRVVLLADAATFVAGALLLARLPRPAAVTTRPVRLRGVLRDRRYVAAAALTAVLYLYMPVLTVGLPLWLAARTAAPAWTVALLFVVNTAGVLALQVRAARTVTSTRTAATAVRRAGFGLLAACAVWACAAATGSPAVTLALAGAGALVQVLAEVFLAAGAWHLSFALADPDRPGEWQGLWTSGVPLARAAGPALLVALLLGWDGPGWLVLGGTFALAGVALHALVRRDRSSIMTPAWSRA